MVTDTMEVVTSQPPLEANLPAIASDDSATIALGAADVGRTSTTSASADTLAIDITSMPSTSDGLIPVLSLIVAILAVFVGPSVQLLISRAQGRRQDEATNATLAAHLHTSAATLTTQQALTEQTLRQEREMSERSLRATVRSSNRVAWIEQLRDELAAVIAAGSVLLADSGTLMLGPEGFMRASQELRAAHTKTRLLLNPDEPTHARLLRAVDAIVGVYVNRQDPTVQARHGETEREFEDAARSLLKSEWERAKRYE